MGVLGGVLKELAFAAGRGLVTAVGGLLGGKSKPPDDPPHVTYHDVEHQRAQEKRSMSFKVVTRPVPESKVIDDGAVAVDDERTNGHEDGQ